MGYSLLFVIIVIIIAWTYDYYNGANDAANSIATTVSTRVLTPFKAILLAAMLNFIGALITTEVAKTVGKGIVVEQFMTPLVVICSVIGAVIWAAFSTHRGIPVSVTHCIVGGIIGAGVVSNGFGTISWIGLKKIISGMILSPLFGFIAGLVLIIILFWLFRKAHPIKANSFFGKAQVLSASFMALTHGMNDAQNAMGIITAALLASGFISSFKVPLWVIIGSATFIALGTLQGGKKVIKTMGMKLTKIKPIEGFSAETASAGVILVASLLGIPISTTHVISCAIMGVGSSRRFSAVRWGIAGNIVLAWILTIPATAFTAGAVYFLLSLVKNYIL